MSANISQAIGASIPNNTPHAVSVTLPTWEATVGYEEGEKWVTDKMKSGYPRFFIHSKIQELAAYLEEKYGREGEKVFIFPSYNVAKRCREFIRNKSTKNPLPTIRILQISTPKPKTKDEETYRAEAKIAIVFLPESEWSIAKQYWQHSGEGISSRLGEYVLQELQITTADPSKDNLEYQTFIEERFGRNLNLSFAQDAKLALRSRIAGNLGEHQEQQETTAQKKNRGLKLCEDDVYLYPTGMAAIFNAHLVNISTNLPNAKSVCFGFPYVDTLNILKKFGPGVHFFGFGDNESLLELEELLKSGERVQGFYCECPSNPLLKTPNLVKAKQLADTYNFPIIIDETVGNFLNIDVLPYADILVSSLTKVFSGDSNVMGGSLVLNPNSRYYPAFKEYLNNNFEDLYWGEDAIYLERNSRDFEKRSVKVNQNSEIIVNLLQNSPLIKDIYYPSLNSSNTLEYYEKIKTPNGGYGGLISIVFHEPEAARCFFNALNLSKGPSLGTNFTLCCPYAILAHYTELDEVEKWGVDRNLVRISIGLEESTQLAQTFQDALAVAAGSIN
ncbi:hypothetical protein WICPIJ_007640 [Wickerhamomyces pijperi]|uniref:cystathionine gamma-synthase n=1 Tax=Wickerhamomyces pijperi TaxID=599730 RepID=A0A9P8PZT1_WICPI|nr:hypothetical protein WICPIJ_007640 [Wickerhamomyces pijperi]